MKIGITERGDAALTINEWYSKLPTVDGVILITKDPLKLYNNKNCIPPNSIIHTTITGFGRSSIERNVPSVENAIDGYNKLINTFGGMRVVLRVDPIIPTKDGISKAVKVLSNCKGRSRISILDLYMHVKARLLTDDIKLLKELEQLYIGSIHAIDEIRIPLLNTFISAGAEVCGEPGVNCTGCISTIDLETMDLPIPTHIGKSKQRDSCKCIAAKTELLSARKQCPHRCSYCYWKTY